MTVKGNISYDEVPEHRVEFVVLFSLYLLLCSFQHFFFLNGEVGGLILTDARVPSS